MFSDEPSEPELGLGGVSTWGAGGDCAVYCHDDEADDGGLTRPSPARVLTVAPDDVCVCCLELLALENTKVMACCGTTLHARCLSDWLAAAQRLSTEGDRVGESATCPNCRQVIPLSISVLPNPRMQYA